MRTQPSFFACLRLKEERHRVGYRSIIICADEQAQWMCANESVQDMRVADAKMDGLIHLDLAARSPRQLLRGASNLFVFQKSGVSHRGA